MNLLLQTETFLKNNLTDEEVLYMLILSRGCSIEKAQESLLKKGFITQDGNIFADYRITKAGVDAVNAVVLDSDKKIPTKTDKELRELASDLIALFPKGYQQGNRYPWRMSPSAAVERLRSFFLKFNNDYTFDEIARLLEETKQQLGRDYPITLELLGMTPDCSIYHKLHDRMIISNYYLVEASHKLAAFNKDMGTARQLLLPLALFTESSINGKSTPPLDAINQALTTLRKFSKSLPHLPESEHRTYFYAVNGIQKEKCLSIRNRLLK